MALEEVLFEQGHARVTTTKVQIGGTTYPLNGITSVRTLKRADSPLMGILLLVFGASMLVMAAMCGLPMLSPDATQDAATAAAPFFFFFGGGGAIVLLIGITTMRGLGTRYAVVLGTAGGDRQALVTRDGDFAAEVRDAIEQAITRRG